MQRNWIGRSTGADVEFDIEGRDEPVTIYTTRPDTLFGATFFVVAADSDLAAELAAGSPAEQEFPTYLEKVARARARSSGCRPTGRRPASSCTGYAINPVNGERLPIWAADYVLADYGHGAIMAVPAHDQRDLDFARAFDLPVRVVVDTGEEDPAATGVATTGDGVLVNSGPLDGLGKERGDRPHHRDAGRARAGARGGQLPAARLADLPAALLGHAHPDRPLPVLRRGPGAGRPAAGRRCRRRRAWTCEPKGTSPLGAATDWVNVDCPRCGGPARRDTDTMDTFVDSSWYFLRFCSPDRDDVPFDPADVAQWMPVDQYVGGVTHAILHLLYARFFTKVLHDLGMVDFTEPFQRAAEPGHGQHERLGDVKSRGNLVRLSDELAEHGVDAVRLTMVFAGPPEDDIDWADVSPAGSARFLARAWRLAGDVTSRRSARLRRRATSRCAR